MGKKIILLFSLILFISLVSAVKPEPQIISNGCEIRLPQATTLKQNQDIDFHTHVINTTAGASNFLTNDTTTCFVHLYNHSGHTLQRNMSWDTNGLEWHIDILGGNFSQIGEFAFYIQCQSTDVICADSGAFLVTPSGRELSQASSTFYIVLFGVFIFLFVITIFGINKLPDSNATDDEGTILKVSYLKYFRSVLWFVAWMFVVAILYISSSIGLVYLEDTLFASFLFTLFRISLGLTFPIVIMWFVWILAKVVDDSKIRNLWQRGMFPKQQL